MQRRKAAKKVKKRRKKVGKPKVFDRPDWPQTQATIIGYVRGVHYVEDAVVAAGLSESWWYKCQQKADDELEAAAERMKKLGGDDVMNHLSKAPGIRACIQFVQAVRQARAESTVVTAERVRETNPLEYLARTQPSKWGRRDRIPYIDPNDGEAEITQITRIIVKS